MIHWIFHYPRDNWKGILSLDIKLGQIISNILFYLLKFHEAEKSTREFCHFSESTRTES